MFYFHILSQKGLAHCSTPFHLSLALSSRLLLSEVGLKPSTPVTFPAVDFLPPLLFKAFAFLWLQLINLFTCVVKSENKSDEEREREKRR